MSTADLASLVARLEQVTVRLEKAASGAPASTGAAASSAGPSSASVEEYQAVRGDMIGSETRY